MNMTAQIASEGNPWFGWAGSEYRTLITKEASAGSIGIFEGIIPAGDGPPIHIHHEEDEVIHVLEGRYKFWLNGDVSIKGPGSSVFLPRGIPHSFQVIGPEQGRNLAIVTPGGFEGFFTAVAAEGLSIPEDMDKVGEIAGRYGLEFTGPPLAML